ncbi:hypothetical protein [Vibrio coralliirubri]|uniref:hypothetical protein n=1 Tax=Vibrio coralliirubri TaxID=1516159 RepID=UPI000A37BB09|nr:hypothetical protein [Vibrio coralliirubri]
MAIKKDTTITFIEKAVKKWGDKYDYQYVQYINSRTPVKMFCRKHSKIFWQTPKAHFIAKRHCCPACYKEVRGQYQNEWRNKLSVESALLMRDHSLINQVFCC